MTARTAEDVRVNPQVGDTWTSRRGTVFTVTAVSKDRVWVTHPAYMYKNIAERWSRDLWEDTSEGGVYALAAPLTPADAIPNSPATRNPRANPQIGDWIEWVDSFESLNITRVIDTPSASSDGHLTVAENNEIVQLPIEHWARGGEYKTWHAQSVDVNRARLTLSAWVPDAEKLTLAELADRAVACWIDELDRVRGNQ